MSSKRIALSTISSLTLASISQTANTNALAISRKEDKSRFIDSRVQTYIKQGHNRNVAIRLAKLAYKDHRKKIDGHR